MDARNDRMVSMSMFLNGIVDKIMIFAHFIRLSHTIFSLPFALTALVIASVVYHPVTWDVIVGVIFGLACLRASAMTFNRIVDRNLDALNPRTMTRELVTGKITLGEARVFLALTTMLYILASFYIQLPWFFIFVFLLVTWSYSFTKRFTWTSHFWLGLALAGAPIGTWLVVAKNIDLQIVLLALAVVFWVAGFDILYSLQDREFDLEQGLHSIPTRFGVKNSLLMSRVSHLVTTACLILFGLMTKLSWVYFLGTLFFALGMLYEQSLVKPHDLSRIDRAFFTTNGILSVLFFIFTLISVLVR